MHRPIWSILQSTKRSSVGLTKGASKSSDRIPSNCPLLFSIPLFCGPIWRWWYITWVIFSGDMAGGISSWRCLHFSHDAPHLPLEREPHVLLTVEFLVPRTVLSVFKLLKKYLTNEHTEWTSLIFSSPGWSKMRGVNGEKQDRTRSKNIYLQF